MTLAARRPAMSEADFLALVIDYARLRGWRLTHSRPARTADGWRTAITGDAGFPDLLLVRPPRLVFAELKSSTGRATPDQKHWLMLLGQVPGVEVFQWRPGDFGEVEEVLR